MDWKSLIADLIASGYTQPELARKCNCSQPTISELATGKTVDPRDSIGQCLRELHRKAMKAKQKAEAR